MIVELRPLIAGILISLGSIGDAVAQVAPPKAAPAAVLAPSWPEAAYNPQKSPGDLLLPTPCGGAIAFRRINTLIGESHWLADQQFRMGVADPKLQWREDLRFGRIAGGFSDNGEPNKRYYYLAKYELTQAQYDAVMGKPCDKINIDLKSDNGTLPAEHLNWFDAVEFSRQYSEWLRSKAPNALPKEGPMTGFIRPPTEAEWEYAARGGGGVLPSELAQQVFPYQGLITDYVWVESNSEHQTQPIGLRKPNPLGLYDILGNVAEITLDLYYATAPGRLHGQPGGFVYRGGNYKTSEHSVRTSERQEAPFYDDAGAARPTGVGFRPAIAAPVNVSHVRVRAFETATATATTAATAPASPEQPKGLAEQAIQLSQMADNPKLAENLKRLASEIQADKARKDEQFANAARSALMSGAVLLRAYRYEKDRIADLERRLPHTTEDGRPKAIKSIQDYQNRSRLTGEAYLSLLTETSNIFPIEVIRLQTSKVEDAFSYQGSSGIINLVRLFVDQSSRHKTQPTIELNKYLEEALR